MLDWLKQPVTLIRVGLDLELPLGFFLPLIARRDLRSAFPLLSKSTVFDYLYWVFTNGARDGYWNKELSDSLFACCDPEIRAFDSEVPMSNDLRSGVSRFVHLAMMRYDGRYGFSGANPWRNASALAARLTFAYISEFRKGGFPREVTSKVREWLEEPAESLRVQYDLYVPRLLYTLWMGRIDLKTRYPGKSKSDWLGLIGWFLASDELENLADELIESCLGFLAFLAGNWSEHPTLTNVVGALYQYRTDLRAHIDLSSEGGLDRYAAWIRSAGVVEYRRLFQRLHRANFSLRKSSPANERRAQAGQSKIAVVGSFSAPSGRGEDARTISAALEACGVSVVRVDRGQDIGPIDTTGMSAVIHVLNADTGLVDYIWRMNRGLTSVRVHIGYWAWELDRLPDAWRYSFAFYDVIWGNSEFCAGALRRHDLRPIASLPLAVAPLNTGSSNLPVEFGEKDFVFFFSFDFRSFAVRKNPEAVVRAFLEAFPAGNEPVQLLIKTIGGDVREEALNKLLSLCEPDGRIVVVDGELSREELEGLFHRANVYISLHRAEGFGRGIAEAMLAGKPVIVTDYSGSNEFCTQELLSWLGRS